MLPAVHFKCHYEGVSEFSTCRDMPGQVMGVRECRHRASGWVQWCASRALVALIYCTTIHFTYENSVYSRQKCGAGLDSGVAKDELMILVIRANINQKGQEDHLLHHSCSVVLMLSWRWQRLVGLPSDAISNGRRHRASREHEIQLRSTWRLLLLLSLLPA